MSKERKINKELWRAWLEALILMEAQNEKQKWAERQAAEAERVRDEEKDK